MSGEVTAAVVGVVGVMVGWGLNTAGDFFKSKSEARDADQKAYREQLRNVCVQHATNLTQYVAAARSHGANASEQQAEELARLHHATRVSMELIRMQSNSRGVQESARLSLRHAYAVQETYAGRPDPRPNGLTPGRRFDSEFKKFLIAARHELGLQNPEDVYLAPE